MSLPPIFPEFARFAPTQSSYYALKHMVEAYGRECREAALEEASTMLETGELRGTEQDIHKIGELFISVAKYIRSLK